jgi:hypothetical protein
VPAADQRQIVGLYKNTQDIAAETDTQSSLALRPPLVEIAGIGPQQVARQLAVRGVEGPGYAVDLVEGLEKGTDSPVDAEDLLIDDCGVGQGAEGFADFQPGS